MRWLLPVVLLAPMAVRAEEPPRLQVSIRDHRFQPAELHVPADTAFVVDVQNDDATAEEFESSALGVEKVIAGGRHLPVRIRAMPPGRYGFMGEYHIDTAQGVVVVEPAK
jgi:hypothetical protein